MQETRLDRDYITGIRRGREIERSTQKASIVFAASLGVAFGILLGTIIGIFIGASL